MAHKSKLFEQIEREKFELLYAGQSLDLGDTMEDLLENLY
jgi:hypothetical protein